jgi:hypothetical protein
MKNMFIDEFSDLTDEQIKYLLSRLRKEQKLRKEGGSKDTKTVDWVSVEYPDGEVE